MVVVAHNPQILRLYATAQQAAQLDKQYTDDGFSGV